MKYIKSYENVNLNYYNVGDYVLGNWKYNNISKIIGLVNMNRHESYQQYIVKSLIDSGGWEKSHLGKPEKFDDFFIEHNIDDYGIERKATPNEILKFELAESINKYNI
jgi:hypothetical protein